MYVADMHCDSLTLVSARQGLINDYNTSKKNPHLQFFASFVPKGNDSPDERRRKTSRHLDIYISECQRNGLRKIESCQDIIAAMREGESSAVFSIEGGAGLFAESPELETFHRMGLRVLGLAWDSNELASGAWDPKDKGLTPEGVALVNRCSEMGILIDVSHLSDLSFYQLLEITAYPVLATHSNFRDVCDSKRNLTLDMAKRIAARGGVIGLNLYPGFLSSKGKADASDIIRHVEYGLDNLGEDALGFGFDIDGTDGHYPDGFSEEDSIHDRVIDLLSARYSDELVRKLAGGNVLAFLENNL